MSSAARRTSSGNHPAVIAYRRKMDSIAEGMVPVFEQLNARIDRARKKTAPVDPRREPDEDERRETDPPVDVVTLEPPPSRGGPRK